MPYLFAFYTVIFVLLQLINRKLMHLQKLMKRAKTLCLFPCITENILYEYLQTLKGKWH